MLVAAGSVRVVVRKSETCHPPSRPPAAAGSLPCILVGAFPCLQWPRQCLSLKCENACLVLQHTVQVNKAVFLSVKLCLVFFIFILLNQCGVHLCPSFLYSVCCRDCAALSAFVHVALSTPWVSPWRTAQWTLLWCWRWGVSAWSHSAAWSRSADGCL